MPDQKPAARVKDGYVQIYIADSPGCLARVERWLKAAVGYALVGGLGFVAGVVYRSLW